MTMTRPTVNVSVIIPCFNNEDTIERALRSVEHQTARPLEVLVVDDASTDGTREVVRRFAEHTELDVKLTALAVNGGPARARNTAWDQAKGDYIAFLDADDAWHPRKLELQYQVMADDPSLALSGHPFEVVSNQAPFRLITRVAARNCGAQETLLRNGFHTPSVMLRRTISQRFNEEKRYCEDYLLWLQILLTGGRGALIDQPLFWMYKASYGSQGLSSHLYEMQRAEIDVYYRLARKGLISRWQQLQVTAFSILKYVKRLIITKIRVLSSISKFSDIEIKSHSNSLGS